MSLLRPSNLVSALAEASIHETVVRWARSGLIWQPGDDLSRAIAGHTISYGRDRVLL
jgi:hypothetical protein